MTVGLAVPLALAVAFPLAPGPLYSEFLHQILLISTGLVEMRAGLVDVKSAEPTSLPSASLKAWQEMEEMGSEEDEVRERPQIAFASGMAG